MAPPNLRGDPCKANLPGFFPTKMAGLQSKQTSGLFSKQPGQSKIPALDWPQQTSDAISEFDGSMGGPNLQIAKMPLGAPATPTDDQTERAPGPKTRHYD